MTDRYNAIVVTFDHPIREDDLQEMINAFKLFKNVIHVEAQASDDISLQVAREQERYRLKKALIEAIDK